MTQSEICSPLLFPVFVVEGKAVRQAIAAMPGQFRYSIDTLTEAVGEVMATGIKSIMLFGVVSDKRKSKTAEYAWNPEGLVQRAVYELKKTYPGLLIFTDVCVCEYSMLIATARNDWGDLKTLVRESIFALSRAGSDIIISYWANQYDQFIKD